MENSPTWSVYGKRGIYLSLQFRQPSRRAFRVSRVNPEQDQSHIYPDESCHCYPELDRIRNGSQTPAFGSSGEGIPPKLKPIVAAYQHTLKQSGPATSALASASQDYDKLMDSSNVALALPVFAARLNGLLNVLRSSCSTVSGYVKARKELVAELESLLAASKTELEEDEKKLDQLAQRANEIMDKKNEVEMEILRGLGPTEDAATGLPTDENATAEPPANIQGPDLEAPEMEALTPPAAEDDYDPSPKLTVLGVDSEPAKKRRRMDSADDDFPDLGQDDGIDADVAEMLQNPPAH